MRNLFVMHILLSLQIQLIGIGDLQSAKYEYLSKDSQPYTYIFMMVFQSYVKTSYLGKWATIFFLLTRGYAFYILSRLDQFRRFYGAL